MTVLIVIASIVGFLTTLILGLVEIDARRTMGISSRTASKLSWPARQTMRAFHKVPTDNRPTVDMVKVVMALDKKHGGPDKVDRHFSRQNYGNGGRTYAWNEAYGRTRQDYEDIYGGLEDITRAIAEREHEFAMAGISSHLDTAKSLRVQMREEADTIREITAKVREDMK